MGIFKTLWEKIKRLFTKRPPSTEQIISEEKSALTEVVKIKDIYIKIQNSSDEKEKETLIKQIARQKVAEDIIKFVENEGTPNLVKKGNRKYLYELHELRIELQKLEEQKAILNLEESKIKPIIYPDTSSFDIRINKLFSLLSKNKANDKVELSDFTISAFDKDFKRLERLLTEKSSLRRHKTREQEKRRQREIYESNIKKELNNLDSLIGQNRLDDAKQLINRLTKSIKPDYKKGIERLSRAVAKLKEKELDIFKKRQAQLLRQQQEEAERIRIEQEQKLEQQRIAREQAEALRKIEEAKKTEKENKLKALLTKKFNWRDFQKILQENGISGFYHFTDRSNLKSIKENGGLFSWYYCDLNSIEIPMPGGSLGSRQNDTINGKKDFVRVAFNKEHPMLFIAQRDGRISRPVWLDIDIEVAYFEHTEFSDKNAAAISSYTPMIGKEAQHLSNIRFDILKKAERVKHYNLLDNEKPYNQAEVLVKTWIPIEYIKNIESLA
jgi:hypothetical protein